MLTNSRTDAAYAFLGDCLIRGKYWNRDRERGLRFLEYAAEQNNTYAVLRLGQEYLYGGDDLDDAEYWLKTASDNGNYFASYTLYNACRMGKLQGSNTDRKRYLLLAVDKGVPAAEYRYSLELQDTNHELAREYLEKSASHGLPHAMYLLGKRLMAESKTVEALEWLEKAAKDNDFIKTQLGLFYHYRLHDEAKATKHLNTASANGYTPARTAIQNLQANRNAQIATGIANMFADLCGLFEERTEDDQPRYDGIDSRQKREEREKREAWGMRM